MSLGAMDSALSGLRIAQQQLNIVSTNIANVGTDGYTRKILPQSTVAINGEAVGVTSEIVTRYVRATLAREVWTQVSVTSGLEVTQSYLDNIQNFHGPSDAEVSLSAIISGLRDSFSQLSDLPEDDFLLRETLNQAQSTVSKINDFADLLIDQRNDTQTDIQVAVNRVNDLLEQIETLNDDIKGNTALNKTTAQLEDQRDIAVKKLSELMEITFFTRGDGLMVIQTARGEQLVDDDVTPLYFSPSPIGTQSSYPENVAGIWLGGNPAETANASDITETGLGGKIGALLDLRDEVLPRYLAQLDEFSHKLATRFASQGLELFTDPSGTVPPDTEPTPDPPGPATAVSYVGFSTSIQVNDAVVADPSLIRSGTVTSDRPVQTGSNEVIRRIVEFAFGDVAYQEAVGTNDIRAQATGGVTLQEWLGIYSTNQVTGTTSVEQYSDIATLFASGGDIFIPAAPPPAETDQFQLTFDNYNAAGSTTITIDLSDAAANYPIGVGINDALDQIISEINNQIALAGIPADVAASASRNAYGQLVLNSRADITVTGSGFAAEAMGDDGLEYLGLSEGTYQAEDPYFEIQIGNKDRVKITIEPGDTETDLENKLTWDTASGTGVPGLYVDIDASGNLTLRPGNDDSNGGPVFGGDMKLFAGTIDADGTGGIGVPAGVNIISTLFGSYTAGPPLQESSPVNDVTYGSLESSVAGAGTVQFRSEYLGPNATVSTQITGATNLIDYAQRIIAQHAEEATQRTEQYKDEQTYLELVERQLADESGVNIDEELSHMIVIQTAYSAAARVLTVVDEMFAQLIEAV